MIAVILIEPEHPGNVGAIARVMANFGFKDLILINPKCNHLDQEAKNRAKHAQAILRNTKVRKKLTGFQTLIGTTAQIGSDYNIPRSPITPSQLKEVLPKKGKTALILGRESEGLTNAEILMCDFIVTIPTSSKYPTLNLSHAAAILCYELQKPNGHPHKLAEKQDKDQILKLLKKSMKKLDFKTEEKQETQLKVWKRMMGKSFLTRREAFALMGYLKKIIEK